MALSDAGQVPTGAWSHLMTRRQGATSEVLIGSCNQSTRRRWASTNRLAPLSLDSDGLAVRVSEGVSQYGLASGGERLALLPSGGSSVGAVVIDSLSWAPTSS
jgi:hypothetical protein